MKTYRLHWLALTCLLMCIAAPSTSYAKKNKAQKTSTSQGDFNHPDFAYPATTAANAMKVIEGRGSDADKVLALIQYSISTSSISSDSIARTLSIADSLARCVREPYRAVVLSLEAQIYADIYSANRSLYDNRILPPEAAGADFKAWNARMFRNKILSLIDEATANIDKLAETPSKDLASLYADKKYDEEEYPTVASVIVSRLAELPRIGSPYSAKGATRSIQKEVTALADRLLETYATRPDMEAAYMRMALIKNNLFNSGNSEWLAQTYTHLEDSQWCIPVLIAMRSNIHDDTQRRDYYNLVTNVLRKFPEGRYRPNLQNIATDMSRPSIAINGAGQYLSSQPIEMTADVSNANHFYLHLFKLKGENTNIEMKNINAAATYLKSIPVTLSDTVPFAKTISLRIDNPGYGNYIVTASPSDNPKQEIPYSSYRSVAAFRVSDLTVATSSDNLKDHPGRVYVASATNFAPITDASVTLKPRNTSDKVLTRDLTLKTNAEGFIETPEGYFDLSIKKGSDRLSSWFSKWNSNGETSRERLKTTILTDLPIYHPGDSVGFSVIAYTHRGRDMRSAPEREICVELRNANYTPVDTVKLKTDAYGRANGCFAIPDKGVLGLWSIVVYDGTASAGSTALEVAEYKAPTFMVETLPIATDSIANLNTLDVKGRATTFSGMPLQDASVSYTVSYGPRWNFGNTPQNIYAGTCSTGIEGDFSFSIPLEDMKTEEMRYGIYTLNIAVTSVSGETQDAPSKTFVIDPRYDIVLSARDKANISSGKLDINAAVYDQMRREVKTQLQYKLEDSDGKLVAEGIFPAGSVQIDSASLPSGKYRLTVALTDDSSCYTSSDIILYRTDDKTPPVETALWVPIAEYVAEPGATEVAIKLGSSYADSYILAEVSDVNGILSEQWLKADGDMTTFRVAVPEADNRIRVRFGACHNIDTSVATVTVYPATYADNLKVEVVSMRDKTTAGSEEKWTFRFNFADKGAANIPVVATMTDKALNQIVPFSWSLNPRSGIHYPNYASLSLTPKGTFYNSFMLSRILTADEYNPVAPVWQTYKRPLYNPYGGYAGTNYRGLVYATACTKSMGAMESAAIDYDEAAVMTDNEAKEVSNDDTLDTGNGNQGQPAEESVEVREAEHPLAFFMPNLSTDRNGNVELSFTVPNFNTTWQLQIAGYTPEMYSAVGKYYSVSSKPVMTTLNLPRFLRTGDVIELSASIFNAQETSAEVDGILEVFNPLTDEILACTDAAPLAMEATSQSVVRLRFTAPSDLSAVGIRSIARCGQFTDAEQAIVPILPSSSPVIESQTFYLQPNEKEFEMNLKPVGEESNVTLQYCDNPVWYCVTALPSMTIPKDCGILARTGDYVARALAVGLVEKYPEIAEAIKYWEQTNGEDANSTLVSPLKLNETLKMLGLENTTWVNDAASETMRMQDLASLLNTDANSETLKELLYKITSQQHRDGGFSWMPEWKSSDYVTRSILSLFAVLRQTGVVYSDYPFAPKAMAYVDTQVHKRYTENKSQISTPEAVDWLYLASFYPIRRTSKIEKMRKAAYSQIQKDWKSLDIDNKSRAAIVLKRNGDNALAKDVLESVRQFATSVPSKGMFFDNLQSGWAGLGKLVITAHVLEAYAEILPEDPATVRLRQWLILQKQAQNWGAYNVTSEVIAAILTSGTDWTVTASPAVIRVGSERIDFTGADKYTGSITKQIAEPEEGATLQIERTADGPAWGAVISQSIKPIDDVEEYGIEGLSISKAIYSLADRNGRIEAADGDYAVGDKVRVTLTITNKDDLQYVTVTDERGACFEPVVQLSEYRNTDRIWYYQEQRNTQTNLLIEFLPKGTHVISYDCYLNQRGTFTVGIATAQSQYAPSITAHSKGKTITVNAEH